MQWIDRIGRRLKLRDLHVLLAVAQAGSMSRAADRLAISHPVVSKTIADLEHALRCRLARTGRSLRRLDTSGIGGEAGTPRGRLRVAGPIGNVGSTSGVISDAHCTVRPMSSPSRAASRWRNKVIAPYGLDPERTFVRRTLRTGHSGFRSAPLWPPRRSF